MSHERPSLRQRLQEVFVGKKIVDLQTDLPGQIAGSVTFLLDDNTEITIGSTPNVEIDSKLTFEKIEKVKSEI
jgi:hypothetical protein